MSLLGNEFNFHSLLHGQVSLAAVNQIDVIHEAISKDSLKACFENVNKAKCNCAHILTPYILMDFPIQIDTVRMGLPDMYFKGS